MSEKVVLTQHQAEAIRLWLSKYKDKAVLIETQTGHLFNNNEARNGCWDPEFQAIGEMSVERLARALFIGYEVEKPKFQAGDKIIHCNEIFTLEEKHNLMDSKVYWSFKEAAGTIDEYYLTKATAEEIYWLHELGRDKAGDFREGDVVQSDGNRFIKLIDDFMIKTAISWHKDGLIEGIYPAESFKPFFKAGDD